MALAREDDNKLCVALDSPENDPDASSARIWSWSGLERRSHVKGKVPRLTRVLETG